MEESKNLGEKVVDQLSGTGESFLMLPGQVASFEKNQSESNYYLISANKN